MNHWLHNPPCPAGGYTQVAAHLVQADRCPLCQTLLQPPEDIRRARQAEEALRDAWEPPTPQQILTMAQTGATLAQARKP